MKLQHSSTMVTITTSIFAASSLFPPKSPNSKSLPCFKHQHHAIGLQFKNSRRDLAFLSFLSLVPSLSFLPAPAIAIDIGISGPKDWLREQKKKTAKYLLAPIEASRDSIRKVYLSLTSDSSSPPEDLEELQKLLKSAARDCVAQDRNSFVQFQASSGVEVCTFSLIVKNASSLLAKKNHVKLEAEALLDDLIRSFTSLNGMTNEIDVQLISNRERLMDALKDTLSSLDKFEQGVKDCLEI